MLRRSAALLATVAALTVNAAFAGSSWPQAGYDAQHTNFNRTEKALSSRSVRTLHVAWSDSGIIDMVAGSSDVYAITAGSNSRVEVIDAETGAVTRSYPSKAVGLQTSLLRGPMALALWGRRLIVGTTQQVVAMNPSTGRIFWHVPGGANQLVVSGRRLYTGKGCQSVCGALASQSIDIPKGRLEWTHRGNFGGAPSLIGGHLYQTWGEYGGHTSVYDPDTGKLLATMPLYATWTGDVHHTYATVLKENTVTGPRASLQEIGPDGRAIWSTDIGRAGDGAPVYAYGSVFSGSYRFHPGIVAVKATTGTVRWAVNLGRYLHLAAANHLLVAANDQTGQISVLSASSGKVLRQLALPNKPYAVSGLAIAGGTIYVTDASGLTALRP